MPIDLDDALAAYGAAWLEADAGKRMALLETCWADGGRYLDPSADVTGREALSTHIGGFHAAQPGARIELASGASRHHDRVHFRWGMVTAAGAVAIEGVDFGRLAADGRFEEIAGFFGPPPAA
ncbi:nuclear transport factor 2 family protein [Rhodovulum sp. DZ06]|uniref:nuclear transport factor 2 family protein n=1 Tax=Rhodovulum sp. DZ06 TaxID=3425126 RepID=UPI003D326A18